MSYHLTDQDFFKPMTLEQATHLSQCDECCQHYIDYVAQHALIRAPKDLERSVSQQLKRLPADNFPYRLHLFRYSLKIGFAMCVAFFLLVKGPGFSPVLLEQSQNFSNFVSAERINYQMHNLIVNLINHKEEPFHDKKEK